jgi:Xaa-Pro aminopeptidase
MIDFGTVLNGYHMDETRMFAIGSMPRRAMDACRAAMEIRDAVLEKVKPGVSLDELFQASLARADRLGYQDRFLGSANHRVSFIGHGIGLELVEQPVVARGRSQCLMPGMTLALEPKLLFENEFSAGIEDVILVTETGCRTLTRVPSEVFVR